MTQLLQTKIGRLRILGLLEGVTLLLLLLVAVPMKYAFNDPSLTQALGPIHGALFLFFVLNALSVGVEQQWSFRQTTWKVIAACFVPFGTFYIDRKILRKIQSPQ